MLPPNCRPTTGQLPQLARAASHLRCSYFPPSFRPAAPTAAPSYHAATAQLLPAAAQLPSVNLQLQPSYRPASYPSYPLTAARPWNAKRRLSLSTLSGRALNRCPRSQQHENEWPNSPMDRRNSCQQFASGRLVTKATHNMTAIIRQVKSDPSRVTKN